MNWLEERIWLILCVYTLASLAGTDVQQGRNIWKLCVGMFCTMEYIHLHNSLCHTTSLSFDNERDVIPAYNYTNVKDAGPCYIMLTTPQQS